MGSDLPIGTGRRDVPFRLIRAVTQTIDGSFHRPGQLEPCYFPRKASLRAGMRHDWIIAANMKHQPFCDGGSCHNSTREFMMLLTALTPRERLALMVVNSESANSISDRRSDCFALHPRTITGILSRAVGMGFLGAAIL